MSKKRRDWKSASPMGNIPNRKTGYRALYILFFKMITLKNKMKEAIYIWIIHWMISRM